MISPTTTILQRACCDEDDLLARLVNSFHSMAPVSGYTHNFYRYPARFSPDFVRSVIATFTSPGDTVMDPFMGGGTTAVEALAHGRRFVGCDLNPLSTFVTTAKTNIINRNDAVELQRWSSLMGERIKRLRNCPTNADDYDAQNTPWWLRRTVHRALITVGYLPRLRQQTLARCSLLRTAQWALDCRKEIPSSANFLEKHSHNVEEMLSAALAFRGAFNAQTGTADGIKWRRLLTRSAAGIESDRRVPQHWLPPRLVLTSPPYPGVHILYHRWQVEGRRETPAPYWIAGCVDGHGGAFYTFGDRKRKTLDRYLQNLRDCFASVASIITPRSYVVQLIAFSDPDVQLPAYQSILQDVGLEEVETVLSDPRRKPIFRTVPNRKWYTNLKGDLGSCSEFVLVHRKAGKLRPR